MTNDEDVIFEPEDEYGMTLPDEVDSESQPKRRRRRRNANGSLPDAPKGMVALDQAQLSKLWQVVIGGRITIESDGKDAIIYVSLDSFAKALPILLERL